MDKGGGAGQRGGGVQNFGFNNEQVTYKINLPHTPLLPGGSTSQRVVPEGHVMCQQEPLGRKNARLWDGGNDLRGQMCTQHTCGQQRHPEALFNPS